MKLKEENRNVSMSVAQTSKFSIDANAKAFKALINGLYSNKAQSITREIWSNAYDAHVEANKKNLPFEVTFPSVFDNEFRVRDFGPGLSHEDVMGLYSTVFKSTKENSNDGNGKWGLGSKSPFAYTDTYSVTSWYNGEKRTYSAVIGSDGVPTINLMANEPSSEPTGLEVCFPVDSDDVSQFAEAARYVAMGFDVKPKGLDNYYEIKSVVNSDLYKIGEVVQKFKYKEETGRPFDYRTNQYKVLAKMGTVLYPIREDVINRSSDWNTVRHFLNHDQCLVIPFEIGDLEITLSREDLSYGRNEPTIPAIMSKLKDIAVDILEDFKDSLDEASNLYEANKIFKSIGYNRQNYFTHAKDNTSFKAGDHPSNTPNWKIHEGKINTSWGQELNVPYYHSLDTLRFATVEYNRRVNALISSKGGYYISAKDPKVLIYDERKKKLSYLNRRVKTYLDSKGLNGCLFFHIKDDNYKEVEKDLKDLKTRIPDSIEFDDLSKVPFTSPKSGRGPIQVSKVDNNGRIVKQKLTPELFDEGGYFIKSYKSENVSDNLNKISVSKNNYSAPLTLLGIDPKEQQVVIVPKTYWSRFEKDSEWEDLESKSVEFLSSPYFNKLHNYAKNKNTLVFLNRVLDKRNYYDWINRHKEAVEKFYVKYERSYNNLSDEEQYHVDTFMRTECFVIKDYYDEGQLKRVLDAISKERDNKYPLLSKLSGWSESQIEYYANLVNQKG